MERHTRRSKEGQHVLSAAREAGADHQKMPWTERRMIERRRVRRREASGGFQKSAKKNTEPSAACARARIDAPRRPAKGDLHQAPAIYASHGCHSRAPPSPPSHLRRAQELAAGPAPAHMAAPAPHAVRAAAGGARRGARRLGVSHGVPRRVRACLACGARRGGAVVARRPKQAARADFG